MNEQPELTGVLHFTDEEVAKKALAAINEMGIAAKYIAATDIPDDEFPDFMDKVSEGWVFFIEKAKFAEGMSKLGELMGYTED